MVQRGEQELHAETTDAYIDTLVERASAAQKGFQAWSEEATDQLLYALARAVSLRAEELAIATVQETGMGNGRDKTIKNRFESLDTYRTLEGRVGQGVFPSINSTGS